MHIYQLLVLSVGHILLCSCSPIAVPELDGLLQPCDFGASPLFQTLQNPSESEAFEG